MKLSTCIYTKQFLSVPEEGWSAVPTVNLLHKLQMAGQESNRWVAVLPNGMKIALGDPIRHGTQVALFLPEWFQQLCTIPVEGQEVEIKFEKSEVLQKAKSLTLQILGTLPEWVDPVEILEGPLSQLGVLQVGQIIPMPLFEDIHILVVNCDNQETPMFLDGETALHIEQEEIPIPITPTPTPLPTPISEEEKVQESLSGMFSGNSLTPSFTTPTPTTTGKVLGGDPKGRSRLLDMYGKK